jgi:5-methylcytosine-specific restriction endonuclease McrA
MPKRDNSHYKVQCLGKIRDRNICQACGSTNSLEGHHIIDYQYGGTANVDNIVTLCHVCHKQVHRGNLDLVKF